MNALNSVKVKPNDSYGNHDKTYWICDIVFKHVK